MKISPPSIGCKEQEMKQKKADNELLAQKERNERWFWSGRYFKFPVDQKYFTCAVWDERLVKLLFELCRLLFFSVDLFCS